MWLEKRPFVAAMAIALIASALGYIVQYQRTQSYGLALKSHFYEHAVALGVLIEKQLVEAIEVSNSVAAIVSEFPEIGDDEYQSIAGRLRQNRDYILNIAVAPGTVVKHVHPIEGNQAVIGFDLRTRPEQLESAKLSAQVGQPVVSGPVELVQGGYGFIIRTPIYDSDDQSTKKLWGFVSTVISTSPLSALLASIDLDGAEAAIRGRNGLGESGEMVMGPAQVFETDSVLYDVVLPYGYWQVGLRPVAGWHTPPKGEIFRIWAAVLTIAVCGTLIILVVLRFHDRKERAESDLADAIESIADGFAMYDREDRLVLCNSRYAEIYEMPNSLQRPGTPFEDILRYGLDRGQYPEARGRENEWLQERLLLHRNPTESFNQLLSDGRWLKIAESKTANGSIVGFRVDITELKNAQDAAERANLIKSQFVNNINHEMRTPLTIMLGYVPLLSDIRRLASFQDLEKRISETKNFRHLSPLLNRLAEDVKNMSEKLDAAGLHLLNLVNDTLDLSRIEAGMLEINPEAVPVAPLVADVAGKFMQKASAKGIQLEFSGDDYVVIADDLRLRQILVNFIDNAIKFTKVGRVAISTKASGAELTITVSDTGCGIPLNHLPKLFNEFYQGDATTTKEYGGTGLGLAICRKLAELQGARIEVQTEEGIGSQFSLILPCIDASEHRAKVTSPFRQKRKAA